MKKTKLWNLLFLIFLSEILVADDIQEYYSIVNPHGELIAIVEEDIEEVINRIGEPEEVKKWRGSDLLYFYEGLEFGVSENKIVEIRVKSDSFFLRNGLSLHSTSAEILDIYQVIDGTTISFIEMRSGLPGYVLVSFPKRIGPEGSEREIGFDIDDSGNVTTIILGASLQMRAGIVENIREYFTITRLSLDISFYDDMVDIIKTLSEPIDLTYYRLGTYLAYAWLFPGLKIYVDSRNGEITHMIIESLEYTTNGLNLDNTWRDVYESYRSVDNITLTFHGGPYSERAGICVSFYDHGVDYYKDIDFAFEKGRMKEITFAIPFP